MIKKETEKWIDMLNKGIKIWQLPDYAKPKGVRIVGVIPDIHVPYQHKKALEFLSRTFVQRGVTDIVCIGDFFDFNWHSKKYVKNYNIMGPTETKKASQRILDMFANEFPYMSFVWGNHDFRIVSSNEDDYFEDVEVAIRRTYSVPSTWKFDMQFVIDDVCYIHGTGVSGQNGALTMMRTKRMSTVIGHTHSFASVVYSNNGIETNFAMNVGCLVDLDAPVFDYGVTNREKPVLACGIVYSKSYAEVVPYVE